MARGDYLGEFELVVILGVARLDAEASDHAAPAPAEAKLDAVGLLFSVLWARIKALFGRS